ncbi:meiotic recombination protein REC114-like [Clytia hemisphaerica]|uniref:Uncharacterized protein n=1 Tax=Clytia hemisphaerica TaxID=252671 RepID=A0A7M5X4N3_9CNID|eukprot:TCONS_00017250-protein
MTTEKVWKLEKYGRFVQSNNQNTQGIQGKWQLYSSTEDAPLCISLKRPLNLILQHGKEVLESFSLIKSKEWLKVINKTDSVLFLCKKEDKVRRFRIKFTDGVQQCNAFIDSIANHTNVQRIIETSSQKVTSSKMEISPSGPQIITVKSLTQSVMNNGEGLPEQYQSNINITSNETITTNLVKTCLLDVNFPTFVESIEKTLDTMLS